MTRATRIPPTLPVHLRSAILRRCQPKPPDSAPSRLSDMVKPNGAAPVATPARPMFPSPNSGGTRPWPYGRRSPIGASPRCGCRRCLEHVRRLGWPASTPRRGSSTRTSSNGTTASTKASRRRQFTSSGPVGRFSTATRRAVSWSNRSKNASTPCSTPCGPPSNGGKMWHSSPTVTCSACSRRVGSGIPAVSVHTSRWTRDHGRCSTPNTAFLCFGPGTPSARSRRADVAHGRHPHATRVQSLAVTARASMRVKRCS